MNLKSDECGEPKGMIVSRINPQPDSLGGVSTCFGYLHEAVDLEPALEECQNRSYLTGLTGAIRGT